MKLYIASRNNTKNSVKIQVMSDKGILADNEGNARALLAFLKERVPVSTLCRFGMLIDMDIKKRNFQKGIYDAYKDKFPKEVEPKFADVSINPDLLKVIKEYCPEAVKE